VKDVLAGELVDQVLAGDLVDQVLAGETLDLVCTLGIGPDRGEKQG
jgi:hypothetical protein